ncbi:MAG: peptide ABC transporter substrate-binding protein [Rhabdochlamydiaceae bacterium]|nr:peptide ABC transporter substrate-binding protein [Rhabdochlamydiaceae bacterium]
MKHPRFFLSLFGAAVIAAIFYSFSGHKDTLTTSSTLQLNFQEGDPLSLNPHVGIDLRCRAIERLLFEGLTRVDSKGECQLAAAEHVELSLDQLTYTFKLRPHLWSNGEKVTAHQFEASWKEALKPDGLCARSDLFYIIKNAKAAKLGNVPLEDIGVSALDEHTLTVTLENPAPYFLDLLTHPIFSPLYSFESEPTVFNGPFSIQEWKRDVALQLQANPNYWDLEHVGSSGIQFSFVKDPMTVLSLFEKGEIDFIGDPMTTLPLDALSSSSFQKRLMYQDVARTYWIYVNTEKFPYNCVKIRRALAYALDRKMLTDHIFQGCLPHKSPVPRNLSLLNDEAIYADADVKSACQLFEEALLDLGLTRETLPQVILSYSTISGQKTLAEAIQQRWKEVLGIDVAIEGSEWSVLASYFNNGKFQMGGVLRSAVYNDPLYHLEIFKNKEFPYNASFWENEQYQQWLNLASLAPDTMTRLDYLRNAERLLVEEMPVIPIFVDTYKFMTNRNLQGFIIDKSGCIDFKQARI